MTPSISKILATLTAVFLLAACNPQEAKPTDPMTSEAVVSLLDELFMEELKESPEYMTYLGMRERYDEWDDRSDAARDKQLEMTKRHLAIVKAIDQSNLNDAAKLNIAMFIEQSEQQIEADKWRYHSYPINQMRGVHSMIPSFLINQHLIADSAEAQAYIGSIAHTTGVIDQLLEQLKVREEKGIVPPKFVFPLVLKAIDNIISGAPFSEGDDSTILADFSQKVRAINL